MKTFVLGVVVTLVVLALITYCYFALGFAPVATASSPIPLETTFAKLGLNARLKAEMPKNVPSNIQMTDASYQEAANIYKDQCAFCHGMPNVKQRPAAAAGEFPKPPQLWARHGVTDDPPGETYWKVANGIRLTGMPAYKPTLNDQQLWEVTMLLKNADKLPQSAQQVLGGQLPAQGSAGPKQ